MKNIELAQRIKSIRTEKGISQEELTEKSGVSLRTIQRLENGEGEPRNDTIKRLANALEAPEDHFIIKAEKEQNNYPKFNFNIKIRIPLYLIGFTLLGGSLGFMIGLLLIFFKLGINDLSTILTLTLTVFMGSIGIISGNYIEKKMKHEF